MISRAPSIGELVASLLAVALLGSGLSACGRSTERQAPPTEDPPVLLRYRFEPGEALRYESLTVERGRVDISIEMRSSWRVQRRLADGSGDLMVTLERYEHSVFPPSKGDDRMTRRSEDLVGARFPMVVSGDGRRIVHGDVEGASGGAPEMLEVVRATLSSHVLRLPEKEVVHGQRWTVTKSPPDAGPGALTTRSRWRVLGIIPSPTRTAVELVCLSTMSAEPMKLLGGTVRSITEFHYRYLFDSSAGVLERLDSSGTTTTTAEGVPDAGSSPTRTVYEATLRLLKTR